jgi:hypothetical protein
VSARKNKPNGIYGYEPPIPGFHSCGTHLRFEYQTLSSILHVLNVDDFAPNTTTTTSSSGNSGMMAENQLGSTGSDFRDKK